MTTIVLSREERDLIHHDVRYVPEAGRMGDLSPDSREEALANIDEVSRVIARLHGVIALYDALGWEEDDPRQSFEVAVSEPPVRDTLVATVSAVARCARDDIHCARRYREEINAGALWGGQPIWSSDYTTVDEAFAGIADNIEKAKAEVARAETLLGRVLVAIAEASS